MQEKKTKTKTKIKNEIIKIDKEEERMSLQHL